MSAKNILNEIVALDEKIIELKLKFDDQPEAEKAEVLRTRLSELLGTDFDKDDVPLTLARCLDMVGSLEDDHAAKILGDAMKHDNPDVRMLCGEVLVMMAEDDVSSLMPIVDTALNESGMLAEEMPYILAAIDDPEAPRVIERFLSHEDANVVVSAIEALMDCGDGATPEALSPLKGDTRTVELEEDGKPPTKATLGDIVADAIELLEMEV